MKNIFILVDKNLNFLYIMSQMQHRANSPSKISKKLEPKFQFSEQQVVKERRNAGKPPEIPRHTASRSNSNRLHSALSLNSIPSSSINSNCPRYLNGRGGTSSLERPPSRSESSSRSSPICRRRPSSFKRTGGNDLSIPSMELKRSQSLDKKSSPKLITEKDLKIKRQEAMAKEVNVKEKKIRCKMTNEQNILDSEKLGMKFKDGKPILTQNGVNKCQSSSGDIYDQALCRNLSECPHKLRRAMSRSPKRYSNKENDCYDKENLKDKKRKDLSVLEEQGLSRSSRRESNEDKNINNCKISKNEQYWKFEKDVMWCYGSNGKRIGYLLMKCAYLEQQQTDSIAQRYEMTFKFSQADSKLIRILMEAHGFKEVNTTNCCFNLYWGNAHFSPNEIRQLQEWQKINHFPRSSELTRKDRLYMNIKRMQRQYGVKLFDFIPASYVLPTEYREFCDTHLRERGTWIVKPVASSQGKGIYLVSQVDQVPPDETSLVCRYLESPLLVDGYKCDLRLYVVVTSLDPLVVYLYEEGLVRLATIKYQHGKNLWNPCIHLTNYSVNKFHSNYVQNEDPEIDDRGNKWSLSAFLRHLKAQGIDTGSLMRSIEDVIIKSLLSASYQMNTATNMFVPHPRNCFELYGFDILIDDQLKPWILEVNLSPSLNIDQPLDLKIKSAMLADLFSLVGIPVYNPNTAKVSNRPSVYRKLPNLRYSTESYERSQWGGRLGSNGKYLPSTEQLRIFRQIREEYERRGGWARIYPNPDSWAMYGSLQECDSPLNYILHHQMYPNIPRNNRCYRVAPLKMSSVSSSGLASSLERLSCYERALPKGLSFLRNKLGWGNKRKEDKKVYQDIEHAKASLVHALENGLALSKYQARMAFSVYLQHVQRRLMIGCDQEKQTDLVYRFLRSASRTLHLPVTVQAPSKTLPHEARAVVISKQLGDFIQAYTKETHLYINQNASASCSSLSSQCPNSSVPTPSEPIQPTPFTCTSSANDPAFSLDDKEKEESGEQYVTQINKNYNDSSNQSESQESKKFFWRTTVHGPQSSSTNTLTISSASLQSMNSSSDSSGFYSSSHDKESITPPPPVTREHSLASIHCSTPFVCSQSPSLNQPHSASLLSSSIDNTSFSSTSSIPTFSSRSSAPVIDERSKRTIGGFFQNKLRRFKSYGDSGLCFTGDVSVASNLEERDDITLVKRSSLRKQSNPEDGIAMELYRAFLSNAGEADLEEVLALQTKMHNSVGVFLDPAKKSRSPNSASSSCVTTPSGGYSSRPRTPAASPHGSPRRSRRSPIHGEKGGSQTSLSEPITNEPHSSTGQSTKDARRSVLQSATVGSSLATAVPASTCCLFGNILKASLKGTKAPFTT